MDKAGCYSTEELDIIASYFDNPNLNPHFVLARGDDSKKLQAGWSKKIPSKDTVLNHAKAYRVGIIPGSIGLVCIDVDVLGKTDEVINRLGKPLIMAESRSEGKFHLFYRDTEINRKSSSLPGIGDVQAGTRPVILWNPQPLPKDYLNEPCVDFSKITAMKNKADWTPGVRNNTLFYSILLALETNKPIEPVIEKARQSGLEDQEIEDTVNSAKDRFKNKEDYIITKDSEGLDKALEKLGIQFRLDERSLEAEVKDGKDYKEFQPPIPHYDNYLRDTIHQKFSFSGKKSLVPANFTVTDWYTCKDSLLFQNKFNAVKEYFNSVKSEESEVTIENWLSIMFGVEDSELNRYAQGLIWRGIVMRTFEPGFLIRSFPVLIGKDNLGKTQALKHVFPPQLQHIYTDDFSFKSETQARIETIKGMGLVELGELKGLSLADFDDIKGFLTRTTDKIRLSYRRDASLFPRTAMFVGTANMETSLPRDPAAAARFIMLLCKNRCHVEPFMAEHRDHLFAEAIAEYKSGEMAEKIILTGELRELLEKQNSPYIGKNIYLEDVYTSADNVITPEQADKGLTLTEILVYLGFNPEQRMTKYYKDLIRLLREEGWTGPHKSNGRSVWRNENYVHSSIASIANAAQIAQNRRTIGKVSSANKEAEDMESLQVEGFEIDDFDVEDLKLN